jgi:hypothetical protein
MLKEIRSILFSEQELEDALKLFNTAVQAILPTGRIISFRVSGNKETAVRVNVVAPKDGEVSEVVLASSHVAAAMLHYCIQNGIPVPRKAKKKIELIDGNLALTLTLESLKAVKVPA